MGVKGPSSALLISVLFTGIIIGCFFLMLYAVTLGVWDRDGIEKLSKDHGNSLAAFTTLAAVAVAWMIHRKEMGSQDLLREDERIRRAYVFRARLSDELMDLLPYTQSWFDYIRSDYPVEQPFPERPRRSINFLIEGIMDVDPVSYGALSDIVSEYQVHHARVTSDYRAINRKLSDLYDTVCLHAKFLYSFNYARHEIDALNFVNFTMKEISSGLSSLMGDEKYTNTREFNSLYSEIEQRAIQDSRWPRIIRVDE